MTPDLLAIYRDHPMDDGDVVLLLEEPRLATEIEGLADHWDPVLRRHIAAVLRELGVDEVTLCIARQGSVLHDSDHSLVGDLVEELAGSGIRVNPVVALPAA